MTHKDINWDKFDEMLEASKETVEDFNRLREIDKTKEELNQQRNKLDSEAAEIRKKYKQEYTDRLNDRLDDYGILTIVTSNNHDEGRIISVTEDEMKVRYTYNYGSYTDEITIPTKELREKGYVKIEWNHGSMFIVDKIDDPLAVFEIIKYRLKVLVGQHKRELGWGEEEVEKGHKRIKEAKAELEKYKKVSDGMITRMFNEISFGLTDLKIDEILKALPREICLYKEDSDESND